MARAKLQCEHLGPGIYAYLWNGQTALVRRADDGTWVATHLNTRHGGFATKGLAVAEAKILLGVQ